LRNELRLSRRKPRGVLAFALAATLPVVFASGSASAQNLFDFLFGGASPKQQAAPAVPQASAFADPFNPAPPPKPVQSAGGSRSSGFCVRMCDGKYFPVTARGGANAAQMCQAFCPASTTRLFSGSSTIDYAVSSTGERYASIDNAFAYRKALKSDCTCNGRDPVGLAPVDLTFDTTLKAGDVVATADGLMAYTGVRLGQEQAADFTPVASYPGLTAAVRAKLGEMKVAPVTAEIADDTSMPASDTATSVAPVTTVPKSPGPRDKRAALN
jgi:hypothetical protein